MDWTKLLSTRYKTIASVVKNHRGSIGVIVFVLLALIATIWVSDIRHGMGYVWHEGTGLEGKTLWDWMELLIIPFVLAFGALLFSLSERRNELLIAKKARETDREIAADRQREAALLSYIDAVSKLLLENDLQSADENSSAKNVAKIRTITTLRILDTYRKKVLVQFLKNAGLHEFVLEGALLQNIELNDLDLSGFNLDGAKLFNAQLNHCDLSDAILDNVATMNAQLTGADLHGCKMRDASIVNTNLDHAFLSRSDLSRTMMGNVKLRNAFLFDVILDNAHLIDVDLRNSLIRDSALEGAKQIEHVTMPDGSAMGEYSDTF